MELVKGTIDLQEVLNYVLPLCEACNDMTVSMSRKPNSEHIDRYSFLNGKLVVSAKRIMNPDGTYVIMYLIYQESEKER